MRGYLRAVPVKEGSRRRAIRGYGEKGETVG